MSDERHSLAAQVLLVTDETEKTRLEARNALSQFDEMVSLIEYFTVQDHPPFKLRMSHLLSLQRTALAGIDAFAGNFRPAAIEIGGSKHTPMGAHLVPGAVEELCDYVNDHWDKAAPVHLAAYVLWRLNWIHPFTDGNGRTARAVAYAVLCIRLGWRLPGTKTVPEQIAADKDPYYLSLEAADNGNLEPLEHLLGSLVAAQLYIAHQAAIGSKDEHGDPRLLH